MLPAVLQRDIEAALRTSRQGNLLRQGLQVTMVQTGCTGAA
jgi:hypothetical protein